MFAADWKNRIQDRTNACRRSSSCKCKIACSVMECLEERRLLASPMLDQISNATVFTGKSLIIPVTASDADGDALTYTITSDNPNITADLHTQNPWLRLSVANFGNMDLQLLRDVAPKTVDTIAGLVQAGYYNGLTFHRVIPGFMIQGGDPLGTGTGGPGFQYDDEFNASAIFAGTGQLAMAKSSDDTNGSQFFITDSSPRYLDFNHTIFGQLVRGFDVRTAISNVPRDTNDKPTTPVVISSAQLIENQTDAVVTLNAKAAGSATITVTVDDGHGGTATRTFQVTTANDTTNDPPFLKPVPNYTTPVNTPVTIQLEAIDLEGTSPIFDAALYNESNGVLAVNGSTITFTPAAGFTGSARIVVGVKQSGGAWDSQAITVAVGDLPITAQAVQVSAVAGQALSTKVAVFADTDLNGLAGQYTAQINWGDGHVSAGTITSMGFGTFAVTGTNTYRNAGTYPLTVTITGTAGATARATSTARVGNSLLTVNAGQSALANEGIVLSQGGSLMAGTGSGWTVTVDYGTGSDPMPLVLDAENRFTLNNAYTENGIYFVNIVADNGQGMIVSDVIAVRVDNVAPTLSDIAVTPSINEGGSALLRGTISDPGVDDTFTLVIDWGQGTPQTVTYPAGTASFELTHQYLDDTPTGTLADIRNISITLRDDDGATDSATAQVTVSNVAPTLGDVQVTSSVAEGGLVTLTGNIADPGTTDSFTLTVNWNDGAPQVFTYPAATSSFSVTHRYDDAGSSNSPSVTQNIVLQLVDDDGGSSSASVQSTVSSVAPVPAATASGSSVRGQAWTLLLSATDPSPVDTAAGFTYTIDWKDGSPLETVPAGAASARHIFAAAGSYNVVIIAADKDGAASPAQTRTVIIKAAELQPDPADSRKKALVVGGTPRKDQIRILAHGKDSVKVMLGATSLGVFKPTGAIRVFAGAGNDSVIIDKTLKRPAELYGDAGNDSLIGGLGNDILCGGDGNDSLSASAGRDLLIGGAGADKALGGNDDDVLIAGSTQFDADPTALYRIMKEWSRTNQTYAQRIAHLKKAGTGYNGTSVLAKASISSDASADVLTGGGGTDFFLYNVNTGVKDKAVDRIKQESILDID